MKEPPDGYSFVLNWLKPIFDSQLPKAMIPDKIPTQYCITIIFLNPIQSCIAPNNFLASCHCGKTSLQMPGGFVTPVKAPPDSGPSCHDCKTSRRFFVNVTRDCASSRQTPGTFPVSFPDKRKTRAGSLSAASDADLFLLLNEETYN